VASPTRASLGTGSSAGIAGRPLRAMRSLLEATCTRQTSSSSSGRTLRMRGAPLTGDPIYALSAAWRIYPQPFCLEGRI
jgi:hypothetical protein